MGIIGALYERGPCRSPQEIPRGRQPWNPTLQKTKGGAPGFSSLSINLLDGFFTASKKRGVGSRSNSYCFPLSRCSPGGLVRERGMSSSYRKRIILPYNLSALAVARLAWNNVVLILSDQSVSLGLILLAVAVRINPGLVKTALAPFVLSVHTRSTVDVRVSGSTSARPTLSAPGTDGR